MTHVDWLAHLRRDAGSFADAAHDCTATTPLPSCPGWDVADLLRHVGSVHYRAALIIGEHRDRAPDARETSAPPGDPFAWYEQGRTALFAALANPDEAASYWTFLGPKPLDWWLRRLADETAVHRVDAELARGHRGPIDPAFAADGVDEQLETYLPVVAARQRRRDDAKVTLRASDVGAAWTVTVTQPGDVTVTRDEEPAAARIRASAVDLYLWLWRRGADRRRGHRG